MHKAPLSDRLSHLLYIESLQLAGAVFSLDDLTPAEWRGLILIKAERNRREIERMKSGK